MKISIIAPITAINYTALKIFSTLPITHYMLYHFFCLWCVLNFRMLFACSYFSAHLQCRVLSMLLFCLPRKVTKRGHSRTTFLRISLTCRVKRAAARVQNGMSLHLTWNALQIERWFHSTLTTWFYNGLCRVRSLTDFNKFKALRKFHGNNAVGALQIKSADKFEM